MESDHSQTYITDHHVKIYIDKIKHINLYL